jgi:hypothetical protein
MTLPRTLAFMTLTLLSGAALAQQCPDQIKKVDDALAKNPKLPAELLAEARKQRSAAERLLKEGKKNECMDAANKALLIVAAG